jgi:diguanylate cyclase (GGDEF)-like protein/PAS domain S-box-containing protein
MPAKSNAMLLDEINELRADLIAAQANQQQKAAELISSEDRFALVMRSANDGLWDWNLQTNEVYYSPRWKGMLGYKEHELDNTFETWDLLVHKEDRERALNKVEDYLSDKSEAFEAEIRMRHKDGNYLFIRSRAFKIICPETNKALRLIGTHVDITQRKKAETFNKRNTKILEMIAKGEPAAEIYDEIARLYEGRYQGMRCSMLELRGDTLLHAGAPSLPKEYSAAVHGLKNGPNVGSCGASTYTGKRVLVEDIATSSNWANIKQFALPHGLRCCWSEPIKSASGNVLGAFGMYYNYPALPNEQQSNDLTSAARLASIIMERERSHQQIQDLAYKDELTKLSNRTQFYITLKECIKESKRNNRRFSLLYIDLDDFKNVNDSLGHDIGDLLLKECAKRLQSTCRDTDYIARLSGDEFCIIVTDVEDQYSAARAAQRCHDIISQPLDLKGRQLTPACSVGIAHFPTDGTTQQALLKTSDTALYEAKNLGKSRYAFYSKELTHKAEHRFKVELCLREAIEKEQLTLAYQPQVDAASGKIISVEALSRWHHPQLGQVTPVEFIETAERIGMIPQLTEWVLKTACNQLASWNASTSHPIRLAVNISPSHFLEDGFVPLISKVIESTGIKANQLELEVTEGVVQTNKLNLQTFKNLKELGVTLAIDDFGTGYSSFASLKHLNLDALKIDKHFIDDIVTDKKSLLLVSSMIEMGHNLEYKITAEGVEEQAQFDILKSLGCEIIQGYLFSKPVIAERISELINEKSPLGK